MNWNLTFLFQTENDFNDAYQQVSTIVNQFKDYEGKLSEEKSFIKYFKLIKEFEALGSKVYQYAALTSDQNVKNVENNERLNRCRMLFYQAEEFTSFEKSEILAMGQGKIKLILENNLDLLEFKFYFDKIFRLKPYILDNKSEKLLSYYSPLASRGGELYINLSVSDKKNVSVVLDNGETVDVTQGNYRALIAKDVTPNDRKKIFEAVFNDYEQHKTTYASIYETALLAHKANAKSRGYHSILESYLFENNIPLDVYYNLVDVASKQNESLKKYIKLRKAYLGLEEYHTYDRFIELASSSHQYEYSKAKQLFYDSIKNYPVDFVDKAHEVLQEGYVDVYEKDGKRTGAYSSSTPNNHPYILLNYDNTLDSVFTLAHEAGHSMHSLYAAENQPVMLQDYTIFVAEIASTFNEHVLLDYFLQSDHHTRNEKIVVLQKAIDNIVSTFYRQTLFADYELRAHQIIENNNPINHEVLSNIMIDLYKQYYDIDIKIEGVKQYVWAYIPHLFFTPFYVYQYATSFAASLKLYEDVSQGVNGAFDRYVNLLKSGGSKYPIDQALDAGVDFTTKDPYLAVVNRMDVLVRELESLLNKK